MWLSDLSPGSAAVHTAVQAKGANGQLQSCHKWEWFLTIIPAPPQRGILGQRGGLVRTQPQHQKPMRAVSTTFGPNIYLYWGRRGNFITFLQLRDRKRETRAAVVFLVIITLIDNCIVGLLAKMFAKFNGGSFTVSGLVWMWSPRRFLSSLKLEDFCCPRLQSWFLGSSALMRAMYSTWSIFLKVQGAMKCLQVRLL